MSRRVYTNSHQLAMDPRVYQKSACESLARSTNIHSLAPKNLSSSTLCYKKSVDARAAHTACYIFRALPLANRGIRSVFGGFGLLLGVFGGVQSPRSSNHCCHPRQQLA